MTERAEPYIGVSGVVEPTQQFYLESQFFLHGLYEERTLALGVKAVHKTQFLDQENKYGTEWYPVGEYPFMCALQSRRDTRQGNLHVAQMCFDPELVGNAEYRKKFVDKVNLRGLDWLDTIQFDMLPWHRDPALLPFVEQVKTETGHNIILQAHSETMGELGPSGTARQLGQYASALDYVLFDASHGEGVRLNSEALRPFLETGYESDQLAGVGFGVAGGLQANVIREDLPVLIEQYPDISWDAEGQLHTPDQAGKRPINMRKAKEYIGASADILGTTKRRSLHLSDDRDILRRDTN